MKRISILTFLAAILISIGSVCAHAQSAVEARIPFAFTVNGQVLPAGTYRVSKASPAGNFIQIRSRDGRSAGLSATFDVDSKYSGSGQLVFMQYGNQYFLHKVLCDAADINVELPTTKLEKRVRFQMAQRAQGQTTVALLRPEEK